MFFRTEFLSAGAVGAPAATIVNIAKAIGAALGGLFGHGPRRGLETLTLSDHDLRDIGLDHHIVGHPVPYDLLDLMPRSLTFGHRQRR